MFLGGLTEGSNEVVIWAVVARVFRVLGAILRSAGWFWYSMADSHPSS